MNITYRIRYNPSTKKHEVLECKGVNMPKLIKAYDSSSSAEKKVRELNIDKLKY